MRIASLSAALFLSSLAVAQVQIECGMGGSHTVTEQTEGDGYLGRSEGHAANKALKDLNSDTFECGECEAPKTGCKLGRLTITDSDGKPVELFSYDDEGEQVWNTDLFDFHPHANGQVSASVTVTPGMTLSTSCTKCVSPAGGGQPL